MCVYSISADGLLRLGKTSVVCDPQGPIRAQRRLGSARLIVLMHSGKSTGSFPFLLRWEVEKNLVCVHIEEPVERHRCSALAAQRQEDRYR